MGRDKRAIASRIEHLKQATVMTFRAGGGTRPDVLLIQVQEGQRQIIKDFGACDPWFARGVGWLLAKRECRALDKLRDVVGVPRLIERLGTRAYLMDYAPATPIMKRYKTCVESGLPTPQWDEFLDRFHALITTMHAHGVTHGDLRSPHNVLISDSGEPWIVDFVSASFQTRPWTRLVSWPFELIHRKLRQVDLSAVEKYRQRLLVDGQGHSVQNQDTRTSDAQAGQVRQTESAVDRAWRRLGVWIRNLSRRLLTERRSRNDR